MPDKFDKDDLKAYEDASKNILEEFKNIEDSLDAQSRYLKMIGVDQEIIKSIQDNQKTVSEKLVAIQINLASRTREILKLQKMNGEELVKHDGTMIKAAHLLELQQHAVSQLSREYSKLQEQRKRQLLEESLGLTKIREITNELVSRWKTGGPLLLGAAVLGYLIKSIWDTFVQVEKSGEEFRKSMGIIVGSSMDLQKTSTDIAFKLASVGVSVKDVLDSFKEIAAQAGSLSFATKGLVSDMSLIAHQLGISQTTSAEFLKNMASIEGTTLDSQRSMTLFVQKLSEAAGTNLDAVMKDVASATKAHYNFMAKSPLELAKASVEAKRMGTSLSEAANSAKQLVSFTSSVRDELEASVLIGKAINLQRARELAYRKDLRGLNEEILRIAKESQFNELDPFQQEAVAKALGKSSDEIGRMLQSEKEMDRLRSSTDVSVQRQLKAYQDLTKLNQDRAKAEGDNLRNILAVKNNAAATTAISDAWRSILQSLSQTFLPVIATTLRGIASVLTFINQHTRNWGAGIATLVIGSTALVATFIGLSKVFNVLGAGIGKGVGAFFKGTASGIKEMGSPNVFKGILAIGLLGVALIPFAGALKLMEGVSWKTLGIASVALVGFTAAMFGLGALLSSGVGAVIFGAGLLGIAALGAALIPLSLAALAAGKGLTMLGNGFKDIVEGFKELKSLGLLGTITQVMDLTTALTDLATAINSIPNVQFERVKNLAFDINKTPKTEKESAITDELEAIKNEISAMRQDFANGSIRTDVYLDSQLLSSQTDRATRFRNGYGINNASIG